MKSESLMFPVPYKPSLSHSSESPRSASSTPSSAGGSGAGGGAGGVSPSFVFLQLYHNMSTFPISPCVPGLCSHIPMFNGH